MLHQTATKQNQGAVVQFSATLTNPNNINTQLLKHAIRNLRDDQTGRICMQFQFTQNSPVMVTQNLPFASQFGAWNGTVGHIIGHVATDSTRSESITSPEGTTILALDRPPALLYIKLLNDSRQHMPNLPPGVIALAPSKHSVKLYDPSAPSLPPRTVQVESFPITLAYACTVEKLQGLTMRDGILLSDLTHNRSPSPFSLYVALSRTTRLRDVTLLQPLNYLTVEKRFSSKNNRMRPALAEVQHLNTL